MKYDEKNKVLYTVNPMVQVTVEKAFGYIRVWGSYASAIKYNPDKHKIKFNYNSSGKWEQLVKAIR